MKSVGELDAVTPHVKFDERRGGNGLVRRGEGTDDRVGNSLLLPSAAPRLPSTLLPIPVS